MRRFALALTALTAACAPEPAPPADQAAAPADSTAPPASPTPAAQPPALAIEGEGLRLFDPATGAARPLPFGTPRAALVTALRFRGPPNAGQRLEECGAGPLDQLGWGDGLSLYVQDGKFVGWALGRRNPNATANAPATATATAPATASGITIGSTRTELESAYAAKVFESTLGTEFEAGTLFGLLDGNSARAKITHLWAGASCNMR